MAVYAKRDSNVKAVVESHRAARLKIGNLVGNLIEAYGRAVLAKSQFYVPVSGQGGTKPGPNPGALKRSGHLRRFQSREGNTRVEVVYDMRYAIFVHEMLSNYHAPPTSAKYLERAAQEVASDGPRALPGADVMVVVSGPQGRDVRW